jgi:hypothetical protein
MWTTSRGRELPRGYRFLGISSPNPRSGDPRRRELAKQRPRYYAGIAGVLRQHRCIFEYTIENYREAYAAAEAAEAKQAALIRSRPRMLAQLRLLKRLLLLLVRTLIAVAMHPDRCTYLMVLREFCVRFGDRSGPVGTTSC